MIVAIDMTNRVHVLWHGFHDPDRVVQALLYDLQAIQQLTGGQLHCCFDSREKTFRHYLSPSYKASRESKRDPGLVSVLHQAPEVVFDAGYELHVVTGFEADDLLATLAHQAVASDAKCMLVTPDKDVRQCLVEGRVNILRSYKRRGSELVDKEYFTARKLREEYGFGPDRWIDYQCLVGDGTDDIQGWPGVGEMTAREWLRSQSLEQVLANRWSVKMRPAQARTCAEFIQRYPIVRQLVTLRTDVPLQIAAGVA